MSLQPVRVLLAEDEDVVREKMALQLRRAGFECDAVADGAAAISLLTHQHYHVLWLDQAMPKAGGTQVLAFARQLGLRTPAVFCSGLATLAEQAHAHDMGVVLYLQKPFESGLAPEAVRVALASNDSPIRNALHTLEHLDPARSDLADACLGLLLSVFIGDIDLARCELLARRIKTIATGGMDAPLSLTRETLVAAQVIPPPTALSRLLTLIDTLGASDASQIAKTANLSEPDVRRTLHTTDDIDIRHWVRLRRVRWTLRHMHQGLKIESAGEDAGFEARGQVARDFSEVLGLTPAECRHPLRAAGF